MIETLPVEGSSSLLFFVFLTGFAFIVLMEYMYPALYRRDTRHLFYFSGLNSQQRNVRTYASYRVMSMVLFAFTFAVFFSSYPGTDYFGGGFSLTRLGIVFSVVTGYLFLRYLADVFLAWLFDVRELARSIVEKNVAMRLSFGVYGLALCFIITYSGFPVGGIGEKTLLWVFLAYIIVNLSVSFEYLTSRAGYLFYYIFYLCIAEICPLFIAWSVFKRTVGMI